MKCALLILFAMLLAAESLPAQVTVVSGKQTVVPAFEATSAVSLDLHIALASLDNGVLSIRGVDAGDTLVVAVTPTGIQEIPVHVISGPPAYPPGFVPPQDTSEQSGSNELHYSSDRSQFEDTLDLSTRTRGHTSQLHFVSATLGGPGRMTFVPAAYYRVTSPSMEYTLLDQTVNDSPLTLQYVTLRGLHIKAGGWSFHGGYTASADFEDLFIPTENELAGGLSYSKFLGKYLDVTPGLYFLRSIDVTDGLQRSAFISSLRFNFNPSKTWLLMGDVAYGHGLAYAGEMRHEGDATKLTAHFSKKKPNFPSLRASSLPGLSGEASWTQVLTSRMSINSTGSISDVELATIQQKTDSAVTNLRFKFSRTWTAGSGVSYGVFTTTGSPTAKTLTLPQQINYDRAHFGAGFQYQFSTVSNAFSNGMGARQSLRLNIKRFQIGEYIDWQKDAISVTSLLSEMPSLQQELQKMGMTAITPDQVFAVLQDSAFLQSLDVLSRPQVVTVPHRLQEGGNLTYVSTGGRPHQLNLSLVADHNYFSTTQTTNYSLTGNYSKALSARNQLQINGSVVKAGLADHQQLNPIISASLRHIFSRAPSFLSGQKTTKITGAVFVDASRQGVYAQGMEPVPQAMVVLDDRRTVLTDASGHFRFAGVSAGDHRIQLKYHSDRQHYFTTPQETIVAGGSSVDFGIAFPKTDLWGYVQDDAGNGMAGVKLEIAAATGNLSLSTDASGKFIVPNVQLGSYRVQVNPESVPFGYSTEELVPVDINMNVNFTSHPTLKIPAVRVLTGTVTVYKATSGRYVPVKGAIISVSHFRRSVSTNSAGQFSVAGLSPGDLEIRLISGKSSLSQTINVPPQPVTVRDDFKISSLDGKVTASVAGTLR